MNKESNFFYVKGTDLDHFYKDLKAAEDNYVDDIGITVLKLGKLNEIFAKKVLSYENIEYDKDKEKLNNLVNYISEPNNELDNEEIKEEYIEEIINTRTISNRFSTRYIYCM